MDLSRQAHLEKTRCQPFVVQISDKCISYYMNIQFYINNIIFINSVITVVVGYSNTSSRC
jgi:hypothetical protein